MTRELIPTLFCPVLLGDGRTTARLSWRLFWQYGLVSHVFFDRPSLLRRLTPWLVCHPLPLANPSQFLALALSDLADEMLAIDRQPLLFLCGEIEALLSDGQLQALESRYLICREEGLPTLFALSILSPEGEKTV